MGRFLLARIAVSLLVLMLAGGGVAVFLASDPLSRLQSELQEPGKAKATEVDAPTDALDSALGTLERTPGVVWRAVRWPLALALIAFVIITAVRLAVRSQRRYVRLRLIPYRADEALPEEVRRLLESWHQQLLERWWRRPLLGQPSFALELRMRRAHDDSEGQLFIVCPERMASAMGAALRSCYPDSTLVPSPALPMVERVVRLKKRFAFIQPLACPVEYERSIADAALNQMAHTGEPAVVQYVLTPVPGVFDRWSRGRFSARERSGARARASNPGDPGLQSELLTSELQGGLFVQHHALFFTEIRVGAASYRGARGVAGALRGSSVAVNRLVERYMRPWARGPLYLRRLHEGIGNPIPGWRRGVLSSAEVAGLWHLPTPGLTSVRFHRSSTPRAVAPPDVSRIPRHALARDELGAVGIWPEDKSDGLGLIGGQKTGKTSLLCRTVQVDAEDDGCALIVLMPKPGDALKALSMIPRRRTVHFLDFESPEVGINPLLADGVPAMVADKIVEAFRDINEEGDIRGSSDRFLRQAAQATLGASRAGVLPGPPALWDMYRMLLPSESAFRERVVEALYPDPRFADTVTFFGRDLPHDLREAAVNTTSKLDAPRNKLLRLLVESLDKVLRHPIQLSLDDVVRNREILVVDGKMGTFGPDNCRVMMQFILNMLYGALQRQQQLPEEQRVRVALKVDEAHLIMNESFANALATLRSAGLEVVAAWQYGEQIQDPKIRGGLMSLLRQRCMFSMGESADAREMSEIAMNVYVDMIKDDPRSRSRVRITPDAIYNMPNHHAICSWISRGARAPAFIAQTIPLETDTATVEHHLNAQRERGAFVPDQLADPLPEVAVDGMVDVVDGALEVGADAGASEADTNEMEIVKPDTPARPPAKRSQPIPDSYTELDLDDVRGMTWDDGETLPADKLPEPTGRDLEILTALWRYHVLFSTQIWRRWWGDSSLRAAQMGLNRMTRAGWVRRFKFLAGERGAQQRVYCITREGFEIAKRDGGMRGRSIDGNAEWREPPVDDPRRILRSLHANAWVLALQDIAPRSVTNWRGPSESRLLPPRRKNRGEWVDIRPADLVVGTSRRVQNLQLDRLEPVSPDATVELRLQSASGQMRFDLLVAVQRGHRGRYQEEQLRRYDALITGWCRLLERFKTLKTPPVVVFVCEDERSAERNAKLADELVTGQVAKAGTEEAQWPCPARRSMFFAAERDVHEGSLEALQLPLQPPKLRARGEGELRRVAIVDEKLLRAAA